MPNTGATFVAVVDVLLLVGDVRRYRLLVQLLLLLLPPRLATAW
jgi:hypothetical protein